MYGSIYCATNSANGKKYVGKTTYGLVLRWRYHLREARSGSPGPLYAAIRKYGEGTFKIEYLASADSQEELDLMEIRYIAELQTLAPLGYNLASGGAGSGKHSQETRRKMSDSHLGKVATAATRENMSKAMKGRTITLAARQKISETLTGRRVPKEVGEKISAVLRDKEPRTRCKRGHLMDSANTLISSDGGRRCKACRRKTNKEWGRSKDV